MSPFEEAVAIYDREPCFRTFDEDLRLHFQFGFVFSTPEYFVMGRAVGRAVPNDMVNPAIYWDRDDRFPTVDCWHIHCMAGDISKAWGILPYPLPFVSFQRKNELRVYRLDALRRLGTLKE